jgi:hypothetical protein
MASGFIQRFKGKIAAQQFFSSVQRLTASTTHTQAGAATVPISALMAQITTAGVGDAAMLPHAQAGMEIVVSILGASAAQMYGPGTDTVGGAAFGTGLAQAGNSIAIYYCFTDGLWLVK